MVGKMKALTPKDFKKLFKIIENTPMRPNCNRVLSNGRICGCPWNYNKRKKEWKCEYCGYVEKVEREEAK